MTTSDRFPRASQLAHAAASYITQQIMPEEAIVSLPVPVLQGQSLVAAFFSTIAVPREDDTNDDVYAPSVRMTLNWGDARVIEHSFMRAVVPIEQEQPIGVLRPPKFAGPMTDALDGRLRDLYWHMYELLDVVAPLYPRRSLSSAEVTAVQQCRSGFEELVPAELMQFYVALNPDFFDWLRVTDTGGRAEPRACPRCGTPAVAGGRFCTNCGTAIPES